MTSPIDWCEADPSGARLRVRVVPRARRSAIAGPQASALRVRVAAPPVEGKANRELVATLAEALGLRPGDLEVVAGARGRDKVVRVSGLEPDQVAARLSD